MPVPQTVADRQPTGEAALPVMSWYQGGRYSQTPTHVHIGEVLLRVVSMGNDPEMLQAITQTPAAISDKDLKRLLACLLYLTVLL